MGVTMFDLRDYQRDSIDAFYTYAGAETGNPLLVLPTGSGKSLVIAQMCQEILQEHPDVRIIIATHVKELIKQDYNEILKLWPEAPVGIYSAGLGRRDRDAQILFAGIQSIHHRISEIGAFDLMMVDEAHLIPFNENTTYRRTIAKLRELRPAMRVVGLTATAFRLDVGRLDRGEGKLFDEIVHEVPVKDLIEKGHLCNLVSKATVQQLDTTGVGKRGGEFIPGQLEIAVDKEWITRGAVKEIIEFGAERKAWLVFCSGVNHARHIRDEIVSHNVSCETILGDTPKVDRDRIIEEFRRGEIKCLVSVMVLGTGFNVPHVDMIALLRPTQSAGLFLQQVGRGLRNATGKSNCLVLDFAGLVKRHGPIDTITAETVSRSEYGERDDEDKAKECPRCHSLVALGEMICVDCGYVWPPKKPALPTHSAVADDTATILSNNRPAWVEVLRMDCFVHHKYNEPMARPTMRVEYRTKFQTYREWICLEHEGYPRAKAVEWWKAHAGDHDEPIPYTVSEGVERQLELVPPHEIQVIRKGAYFQVIARRRHGALVRV